MARDFGYLNPNEMLRSLTPKQLQWWSAVYEAEGMRHEWQQTATICSSITNAIMMAVSSFGKRRLNRDNLTKLTDFLPHYETTKPKQTPAQIARILTAHARSHSSRVKRQIYR